MLETFLLVIVDRLSKAKYRYVRIAIMGFITFLTILVTIMFIFSIYYISVS